MIIVHEDIVSIFADIIKQFDAQGISIVAPADRRIHEIRRSEGDTYTVLTTIVHNDLEAIGAHVVPNSIGVDVESRAYRMGKILAKLVITNICLHLFIGK